MSRVIRWFRVVLPKGVGWLAVLLALVFLAPSAVILYFESKLDDKEHRSGTHAAIATFAALAGCYGAYRVGAFHPAFRKDYREWLARTPWTARKPLPLGPLHIVLQDVIIVGVPVVIAWTWTRRFETITLPLTFLGVYLGGVAIAHFLTAQWRQAWIATFGIALMLRLVEYPVALAIVAVGSYVIARGSLMAGAPWEKGPLSELRRPTLGWPFDQLAPGAFRSFMWPDKRTALLIACLAGCASHLFITNGLDYPATLQSARSTFDLLLAILAGSRLFAYLRNYWPPLSIVGRLRLGKFIIPGYDQVFVGPLVIVLAGELAYASLAAAGATVEITLPVALGLSVWLQYVVGPSPARWTLTGNHRIGSFGTGNTVTKVG